MGEEEPKKGDPTAPAGIDLTNLEGLSLGPQWSTGADKSASRFADYEDRPARSDRDRRGAAPRHERGQGAGPRGRDRGAYPDRQGSERESPRSGSFRRDGDRTHGRSRGMPQREAPFRPMVQVHFHPQEGPFKKLTDMMRASFRTYELFEIVRLFLEKPERYAVVVAPLKDGPSAAETLWVSIPDGLPFLNEEDARHHVLIDLLGHFFETETVEAEPPKGRFVVVNRCGVTKELLGPPNYHRYQSILQEHYASRISNMSFERFQSRIESERDEEQIAAWVEKMTHRTEFRLKPGFANAGKTFDNQESARFYLTTNHRNELVKEVPTARFDGRLIDSLSTNSVIRRSVEMVLEQQRRFPLDTTNPIRGKLRRMHFTVYKRGSKGVSYVCAVKRRFRTPGQVFADSVQKLIDFVETNPETRASDLPRLFLGIQDAKTERDGEPVSPESVSPTPTESSEHNAPDASQSSIVESRSLRQEQIVQLNQLRLDLRWLVSEGYMIEYSDGRLYMPPPMNPSQKPEKDDGAAEENQEVEKSSEDEDASSGDPEESADGKDQQV